nr:putative disease resistance protein [Quercus suber]
MMTPGRKSERKPRKTGAHVSGMGGTNVPESSFGDICGLKFLDLSNTAIKSLPDSVLSLDNLTALTLRGCRNLKLVPSLAKLKTLNKLDLGQTGITEVPHDLEMLVDLRYLSLNASELKIMPLGILPKLSHLQYLTVFWHSEFVIVKEKEIESLKKLETFGGHFKDMDEFRMYIKCLENRPLACYEIRVGMSGDGNYLIGEAGLSRVPRDTFSCLKRILICNCSEIKKLLPPGLLLHLHNLEEIWVCFCEKLEEIAEEDEEERDTIQITLRRLKILHLSGLPELKTICSKEIVCDSLEKIEIHGCPKLRRLPLSLPVLNGQLSPPPYLLKIETSEEWWESLEWDHHKTKDILRPFLCRF